MPEVFPCKLYRQLGQRPFNLAWRRFTSANAISIPPEKPGEAKQKPGIHIARRKDDEETENRSFESQGGRFAHSIALCMKQTTLKKDSGRLVLAPASPTLSLPIKVK